MNFFGRKNKYKLILCLILLNGIILFLLAYQENKGGWDKTMKISKEQIEIKIKNDLDDRSRSGDYVSSEITEFYDPLFTKYLPEHKIFQFEVYSAQSTLAGRTMVPYVALMNNKNEITYINSEYEYVAALSFLRANIKRINSGETARDVALLCIKLLRMRILEQKELDAIISSGKSFLKESDITPFSVEATTQGGVTNYKVIAYVLADPQIEGMLKFTFNFDSKGKIDADPELFYSVGGYD